ncbi:AbrB/MazE/SpoVT family DNA-binding domain-containing protein [Bacillus sp. DX4.1]|uniref:AbrB/MazE/SpoVT family DNA-binding domain-containing protein n=1 Tax=Bacillus sp. DX4.1 TaxID=3055867 RepID=UPI0025A1EF64|nr:AbrB/MazE/SpoVT family DNA-binding domain-containing protein [Bacillus sp. DX4.1]MDM5188772.1 AbrB/MazE/SpoVT family DNA-binding domain-containing protein [Bacillus sp. DX4.1]
MKSTGITRKVDGLGRVVIPKELRDILDLKEKSSLEIFVDKETIVLQKYQAGGACVVTGEISERNMSLANGKITVSPEGAEYLVKQLQQYQVK